MEIMESMEICGGLSVFEEVELFKEFDLKYSIPGLDVTVCKKSSSCPILVILYASMGLHRYNLLKGTNFELRRITKYVKSTQTAPSSYYITLDAKEEEPASSSPPHTTFQILVSEEYIGKFALSCDVARIRGEPSDDDDRETTSVYIPGESCYLVGKDLPEWPAENPFEKYCLVNERELQDKDKDWIHLYLELAVARSDWFDREAPKDYSDLELVDCIAIDGEGLNARNATFYIRFKDLFRARLLGQNDDVDRVAIVRRRFDEKTGLFSLEGQILSSQVIPPKKA